MKVDFISDDKPYKIISEEEFEEFRSRSTKPLYYADPERHIYIYMADTDFNSPSGKETLEKLYDIRDQINDIDLSFSFPIFFVLAPWSYQINTVSAKDNKKILNIIQGSSLEYLKFNLLLLQNKIEYLENPSELPENIKTYLIDYSNIIQKCLGQTNKIVTDLLMQKEYLPHTYEHISSIYEKEKAETGCSTNLLETYIRQLLTETPYSFACTGTYSQCRQLKCILSVPGYVCKNTYEFIDEDDDEEDFPDTVILGDLLVHVTFEEYRVNCDIKITTSTYPSINSSRYIVHPHVSDYPCFGNISNAIRNAVRNYKLISVLEYAKQFIGSYYPKDMLTNYIDISRVDQEGIF